MSFLSNLGNSMLGFSDKATLIFLGAESGNSNTVNGTISSDTMTALRTATKAVVSGATAVSPDIHRVTVQYNPSSLSIEANAESMQFASLQQNIDSSVPNQNERPPSVVLTVEMFFDAVNTSDAFMSDKLRLSVGDAVSKVSGLINQEYTVQPQTNGLIAALLHYRHRWVSFCWADMSFTGQLSEVQADYSMFSVSGRPVRSKVRIKIHQSVKSEADSEYWNDIMDSAFQKGNLGSKGLAGNLLNVNFL